MLAYTPHLTVRRPSPTTLGFSVSNDRPGKTIAFQGLSVLVAAARTLLFCATVLFVLVKLCCTALKDGGTLGGVHALACPAVLETTHQSVQKLALSYPWHIVGPAALMVLYASCRRFHTEESLLVLQSLGIQTCTSSSTYLSTATTRFIPTSKIQDIFIHEAFIGFEVRYYLAIVVKNEPELTVVFPKLLPRRAILEEVWRGARSCLFANLQQGPSPAKPAHHARSASAKS